MSTEGMEVQLQSNGDPEEYKSYLAAERSGLRYRWLAIVTSTNSAGGLKLHDGVYRLCRQVKYYSSLY